jgi:hypothetical protein
MNGHPMNCEPTQTRGREVGAHAFDLPPTGAWDVGPPSPLVAVRPPSAHGRVGCWAVLFVVLRLLPFCPRARGMLDIIRASGAFCPRGRGTLEVRGNRPDHRR